MAAGLDLSPTTDDTTLLYEPARLELARLHGGGATSLQDVWLRVAGLVTQTLQVDRIGVWVLIDEGRALRCRSLYQRSSNMLFAGSVLREADFPKYFEALRERRTISIGSQARTQLAGELATAYLEPLGITALLDAPIYLNGRVMGVVCHEHVAGERAWTGAECDFASTVADALARIYQEDERAFERSALQTYERHLMELHRLEAIGRAAAEVAHDFRGILAAAMGYAELIRRVPHLPPEVMRNSQRIIEAMERGNRLATEVMGFGKDEPGTPRVIDVGNVVARMSSMLSMLIGDRIRFEFKQEHPVARVLIDPAQLERAVLNLVLNARDAMPNGGHLRIELKERTTQNDGTTSEQVVISVQDTGCGMNADTRARLFKPFFTTKGDAGTGLGLVIVDRIATRAGGLVQVDSEVGEGTVVRIVLPCIAAHE